MVARLADYYWLAGWLLRAERETNEASGLAVSDQSRASRAAYF